ncbi:MAG TPA: DUF4129 domain-containing protein [Thermoanaerobaculia bacterium]|jgi:hypothetical protein|nr:DUF4129 domain-containing protein [Thermoanaerobaculia bacterium]
MRRVLLIAIIAVASPAHAVTLTLGQYEDALTRIRNLIAAGDLNTARAEATTLAGDDVAAAGGRFKTDSTLIAEVNKARPRDLAVETRIDATIAALRTAAPSNAVSIDQTLLLRLQKEQTVPELKRGGDVRGIQPSTPLLQRMAKAIETAAKWIGDKIEKFFEWIAKFWPKDDPKKKPGSSAMRWTVGSLVGLILLTLGVLAFEVIRRSRKRARDVVEESAPLTSTRDDDPLSRGANEWERYAAQLAAAGRLREAIRAWYHAVLVTLYGANILHFRKGRTNWEYVAALGPEHAWRAQFIELTQLFEHEWYGSDDSNSEALAACSAAARHVLNAVRRTNREAA